jgi:hypothetical protein
MFTAFSRRMGTFTHCNSSSEPRHERAANVLPRATTQRDDAPTKYFKYFRGIHGRVVELSQAAVQQQLSSSNLQPQPPHLPSRPACSPLVRASFSWGNAASVKNRHDTTGSVCMTTDHQSQEDTTSGNSRQHKDRHRHWLLLVLSLCHPAFIWEPVDSSGLQHRQPLVYYSIDNMPPS